MGQITKLIQREEVDLDMLRIEVETLLEAYDQMRDDNKLMRNLAERFSKRITELEAKKKEYWRRAIDAERGKTV